jgi:hypothetical protein
MVLRFIGQRLYSPEGGAGTATPTTTGGEPGSTTPVVGAPGTQAPAPVPPGGDSPDPKTFTQADLDRIVKERLADASRRAAASLADAKRLADEKALADSGSWQTLAEQRAAEVETLKQAATTAAAYAKLLNGQASAEIADWPEEVKALDPGEKDVEARMTWLVKSRPLAKRLAALPQAPASDAGKGNAGGTAPTTPKESDASGKARYRFLGDKDVSW